MSDIQDYTQLIFGILSAFGQYGPGLVKSITDLVHGNPQQVSEDDAAYVARIGNMIDQKAADTAALDSVVEKG